MATGEWMWLHNSFHLLRMEEHGACQDPNRFTDCFLRIAGIKGAELDIAMYSFE